MNEVTFDSKDCKVMKVDNDRDHRVNLQLSPATIYTSRYLLQILKNIASRRLEVRYPVWKT